MKNTDKPVGDIFTDKLQNREKLLISFKFTDKIIDIEFLIVNIILEKSRWVIFSLISPQKEPPKNACSDNTHEIKHSVTTKWTIFLWLRIRGSSDLYPDFRICRIIELGFLRSFFNRRRLAVVIFGLWPVKVSWKWDLGEKLC